VYADSSGGLNVETSDCGTISTSGTVTSVGLSLPADFTVTGSPVTGSGTLTATYANESADYFLSGPCTGSATTPNWRGLCANDIAAAGTLSNATTGNAATATKLAANTLGCLDGCDHLPCTVYIETNVSESSPTGSYATVWTSTYAGMYRITGYTYATTASSTAYSVGEYVKATQTGQSSRNGYLVASAQIGTTISSNNAYSYDFPLTASAAVQTETATVSGSNTSGVLSRAIVIERLQ
jgi:hypothetical protein